MSTVEAPEKKVARPAKTTESISGSEAVLKALIAET